MPDKVFVDTNIWLYSFIQNENAAGDERHGSAYVFLSALSRPVLNSQVIRETCSNLIKKSICSEERIRLLLRDWHRDCEIHSSSAAQHILASELRKRHSFSYWDSLIVAAALDAGCATLYSEDMQHEHVIDGCMTIINPFLLRS